MPNNEVFLDGNYFYRRQAELQHPIRVRSHIRTLETYYVKTAEIIASNGWQHPLMVDKPTILQMGIEGFHTAKTFMDHVHNANPNASITIADFTPFPLQECTDEGLADIPGITLVQADTTNLYFSDNTFDLIETDGLLQHLSPQEKRKAVAEWLRVLKPGGMVTTRDRFFSIKDAPSELDRLTRIRKEFYSRLGVITYPSTTEVMRYTFNSQGFDTVIQKDLPEYPGTALVHLIVARKPAAIPAQAPSQER